VFISYARTDEASIRDVAEGIQRLSQEVWFDKSLLAGQEWWSEILENIRRSTAFVQAISPASLDSEACRRESSYARVLGKPVIPIMISPVRMVLLPPDLAGTQLVDYSDSNPRRVWDLAGALASCPDPPPLPEPLPTAPPVPVSYLSELSDRVRAATLSFEEQATLIVRLRSAVENASERDAAIEILKSLRDRRDLIFSVGREVDALIGIPPAAAPARDTLRPPTQPKADKTKPPRRGRRLTWLSLALLVFGVLVATVSHERSTAGTNIGGWLIILGALGLVIVGARRAFSRSR
jgi:hypothetical protein